MALWLPEWMRQHTQISRRTVKERARKMLKCKKGHTDLKKKAKWRKKCMHIKVIYDYARELPSRMVLHGFRSMNWLWIFLPSPLSEILTSPLQADPCHHQPSYFTIDIYTTVDGKRHCRHKQSFFPKKITQWPQQPLEPRLLNLDYNALTIGHHTSHNVIYYQFAHLFWSLW